jgi:hypothetical protein
LWLDPKSNPTKQVAVFDSKYVRRSPSDILLCVAAPPVSLIIFAWELMTDVEARLYAVLVDSDTIEGV